MARRDLGLCLALLPRLRTRRFVLPHLRRVHQQLWLLAARAQHGEQTLEYSALQIVKPHPWQVYMDRSPPNARGERVQYRSAHPLRWVVALGLASQCLRAQCKAAPLRSRALSTV